MFKHSYQIARIWGIPVRIHISLILLMLLLALFFGNRFGWQVVPLLLTIQAAVFLSIALHELGHSFIAMRFGCRVRSITLMFIGGAAQMDEMPRRPWQEMLMAAAGPLVSITLALLLFFGGKHLPLPREPWPLPFVRRSIQCNLLQYIGIINAVLAGFNLIPAFPMDGGRILRAVLALKLGRRHATDIAARTGKFLAVAVGLYGFFIANSLWPVFIAFFIWTVGEQERKLVASQENSGIPDPDSTNMVVIAPPPYVKESKQESRPLHNDSFF